MKHTPDDGAGLFAEFMRLADALRMHPDERCDILGVSVDVWRSLVRGTAEPAVLRSERVIRRLDYALGLMRRRLAGGITPPPPSAPPGR